MKIACDNQVSNWAISILHHRGYTVVYKAKNQPDEVWFKEALEAGAEVFVSPDTDILHLCMRYRKRFIRLKQGCGGADQVNLIIRKLAA